MTNTNTEAVIFYHPHLPDAFRNALAFAGDGGCVASMPQLLHARVNAPDDNEIWSIPSFTSNSEENVVTTKQGNHVVVTVHGGGIFASPERFKKLYHASTDRNSEFGFTGLFAAKISDTEAQNVLDGKVSDGSQIPVYQYDEFKRGIADIPRRYAVVMDFDLAKNAKKRNVPFDDLKDDPLMIVRAGGVNAAAAYLDKAKSRNKSDVMGSWHAFDEFDPDQSQTKVLFLGGIEGGSTTQVLRDETAKHEGYLDVWSTHYRNPLDSEHGIRGDTAMINMARYVAVAPRDAATCLRHLSFRG